MRRIAAGLAASALAAACALGTAAAEKDDPNSVLKAFVEARNEIRGTEETESAEAAPEDEALRILSEMTLEEKTAQMFIVIPETFSENSPTTSADEAFERAYRERPAGGFIFFEGNVESYGQTKEMLSQIERISKERTGLPAFACIDEEGGRVARVSGRLAEFPAVPSAETLGMSGPQASFEAGERIGEALSELGFSVDFAPVADVSSNPANSVIGDRSFSSDPEQAAAAVEAFVLGLKSQGVLATLKHFPGHGDAAEDSHYSAAVSMKTLDEMRGFELIPFKAGIGAGADFAMTAHVAYPNADGSGLPASLSDSLTEGLLRNELGFDGIIVTDALNMAAVSDGRTPAETAVAAVEAGCDVLLMPEDFEAARRGLLDAVSNGTVSEERINESVERIIRKKLEWENERRR